jgi:hypothetical protein
VSRLTRERVQQLVGKSRLDDHCIAEIVRTGANESELIEAVNRVARGGEIGAEKMQPIGLNVSKLCEILLSAGDPYSEPD